MLPWRRPAFTRVGACAAFALAAAAQPATITGRVFDVYHRPVRAARVATIEQHLIRGKQHLIPGTRATVDDAGMYRLSLPAGRYVLAVLPPPYGMDHAIVFPAYLQDTADFAKAPSVDVAAGELRPFTDFLLLEVESHRLAGQVEGIPKAWGPVGVLLRSVSGYTEPLRAVVADSSGRFALDHLPAGSYELSAVGPIVGPMALQPTLGTPAWSGAVQIDLAVPEITSIRIHIHPTPR